jgi:NTE family protein
VSKVGLILGGGGVTGASYHFGTLFALQMATGWDPNEAEVIIGTSSGSFVSALIRGDAFDLDALVGRATGHDDVAEHLRGYVYRRARPGGVLRWIQKGVIPGLTRPGIGLTLGSPGMYLTDGLAHWVEASIGELADGWPDRPTVIVAYDLDSRKRVPFGTDAAPDVPLKRAVAASSAVPFVYEPVQIDGVWYADGGVASGTSADLLLANPDPLDLVLVVAPMAASESRPGGRFYEDMFDRVGRSALAMELDLIHRQWPKCEVLVLRPDDRVLEVARPNPMSVEAAIPAFLATLRSMRDELAHPSTWSVLERHLVDPALKR